MKAKFLGGLTASVIALNAAAAFADCGTVRFSDVGWTDITATTETANEILTALGYDVEVNVLGVPVTFSSLASNDIDVFLGNWMPAQQAAIGPYLDKGEIDVVATNLTGTNYTLAVPTYLYDKGLHTYADIQKFGDELDHKIYGIEPGNEGNGYLMDLTEKGGVLEGFQIVESSEQGMLAQVGRLYPKKEAVVFLGWAPHPMNSTYDLKYLTGGEDFFGGEGTVQTVTRKGYVEECPNVGKLLQNMKFTLPMENEIMGAILNDGQDPDEAVPAWLKAHPDVVTPWLEGVTTKDGKEGLPVVKEALGL
ncbi:choline ABC transporter substrate-binding protein [Thioclava sp. GXIMD2076]|uniref:Choline ABC transporter substrate-binding protein n=1 Tax=Thioclava kandeliae TaxID=3070818 RepID=A0ABV1SIM0_9RHOB